MRSSPHSKFCARYVKSQPVLYAGLTWDAALISLHFGLLRPAMLEVAEKLLVLQECDRKIRRVQGELSAIEPHRKFLQQKTGSAQAALDASKLAVKQCESDRKSLELEVEGKKEQINRYANQQLQTRKNEEYRALASEIETCKREITQIEDRQIELMERGEAAHKEVVAANAALAQAKTLMD